MDEVVPSVERQIPDEFCKDNAINTGTNDHAVIMVVAAGSCQSQSSVAVQEELLRRSVSVHNDLDDRISWSATLRIFDRICGRNMQSVVSPGKNQSMTVRLLLVWPCAFERPLLGCSLLASKMSLIRPEMAVF